MMTSRQLRRFNGLIAVLAAVRAKPGQLAAPLGDRIMRELGAPDLTPAIRKLEALIEQEGSANVAA